jgi:hypothetical protein
MIKSIFLNIVKKLTNYFEPNLDVHENQKIGKDMFEEVKKRVNELASEINAPEELLPTYGYSKDFAYPHIEIDNRGAYHYVIIERGEELERKSTKILDELLYWIFANITFSMSSDFELKNRIEEKDSRRMMFNKQEVLIGILNPEWEKLEIKRHSEILKSYPFDDLSGIRAKLSRELRNKGLSEIEIIKIVKEEYPN